MINPQALPKIVSSEATSSKMALQRKASAASAEVSSPAPSAATLLGCDPGGLGVLDVLEKLGEVVKNPEMCVCV